MTTTLSKRITGATADMRRHRSVLEVMSTEHRDRMTNDEAAAVEFAIRLCDASARFWDDKHRRILESETPDPGCQCDCSECSAGSYPGAPTTPNDGASRPGPRKEGQ